jgi:hypothetical protein
MKKNARAVHCNIHATIPRRFWRYIIVGCLLPGASFLAQAQEDQQKSDKSSDASQAEDQNFPVPLPVVIVEANEAAMFSESADAIAEERSKRELAAQEGMNIASKRMASLAEWQTWLIALGTGFLFWTLLLTRQANQGFAIASKKQLRAYLSATPKHFSLTTDFDQDKPIPVNVAFKLAVKNHGQTPAHDVRVWSVVGYQPWPLSEEYVNSFKEELTQRAVINPGQEMEFSFDRDVAFTSEKIWYDPPHTFILFGIIRYETIDGSKFTRICGGLKGISEWYLHARHGVIKPVVFMSAEHSNDAT